MEPVLRFSNPSLSKMESNSVTPEQPENKAEQPEIVNAEASIEEVHASSPVAENPPVAEVKSAATMTEPAASEAVEAPHDEEIKVLSEMEVHHEEIEAEPIENFAHMGKEELLEKMEAFSKANDVNTVKNGAGAAKEAFQLIINAERETALAAYLETGGLREDFDYKDALEESFFDAHKIFQKRRSEFVLGQEKLRQENLKAKNEILQAMKAILQQEEDMSKAFNEFHELQAKWRSIGPVPPQNVNDLWMTYKLYSDRFYEFIKINRELQDLEMKKNLEMKIQLCERAEELMLEPSLNKALQEIQTLQHKWREMGAVPREKRTEIWIRFKAAVDKIYDNKRGYLDSMKQQFEANFTAKSALAEKADALLKEVYEKHPQWQEGLKQLLELQSEWRKIGPAGKEHNDTIWQRFKATCDQFFRNKDLFYKKKKQEYAANLQQKTELCIQAEALKESSDWKATANELIRLQQEWKKIGPAGDRNEKIWQRFKEACDAFFNRKTAHFADQDQHQDANLIKKNELITTVEQFVMPTEPSEAIEQLKAFQRNFTEIGLVPLANKDDIQGRFRTAIQVHFDALKSKPEYRQAFRSGGDRQDRPERNDHRERRSGDRPQRAHHDHAPAAGNDEQRNLQHLVTKLNSEVQLWENNLGFFAKSKNASALKQEYEQKIQDAKDEINKLKLKLTELRNAQ